MAKSAWVKFRDKAVKLATQPSTWRGLAMLAGLFGWHFGDVAAADAIMGVGSAFGLIEIARDERP